MGILYSECAHFQPIYCLLIIAQSLSVSARFQKWTLLRGFHINAQERQFFSAIHQEGYACIFLGKEFYTYLWVQQRFIINRTSAWAILPLNVKIEGYTENIFDIVLCYFFCCVDSSIVVLFYT